MSVVLVVLVVVMVFVVFVMSVVLFVLFVLEGEDVVGFSLIFKCFSPDNLSNKDEAMCVNIDGQGRIK